MGQTIWHWFEVYRHRARALTNIPRTSVRAKCCPHKNTKPLKLERHYGLPLHALTSVLQLAHIRSLSLGNICSGDTQSGLAIYISNIISDKVRFEWEQVSLFSRTAVDV